MFNVFDWADDAIRLVPLVAMWKQYAVALWHTMRAPVKMPLDICKTPKTCRRPHRLAMVIKRGKPGYFVLVH